MVRSLLTIIAIALMLCLYQATALAANITVQPDRSVVQQDESLTVIFSTDSEPDGNPDFSPLRKDFQIINTNQSSNIQFLNGQMSRMFKWQIMLMPKKTGSITIPSISFGADKSRPVKITVKAVDANQQRQTTEYLFMEAVVDTKQAYVQSQIVYTIRIFRALELVNATLSELIVSDPDAVIEQLTDKKTYEKLINGNRYIVFEKQYAIFPQQAGKMVIDPTHFVGQFRDARRILRSKRMASKEIVIDVKPVPEEIRQSGVNYWLPASSVRLNEKWSSNIDTVNVGEPVTRTLTLSVNGLMASQLPELNQSNQSDDIKSYVDQPILNNRASSGGMKGIREEKIAYVPSKPGRLVLPAIEIKWWNTKKDKMEIAKVPERTVMAVGSSRAEVSAENAMSNNQADPRLSIPGGVDSLEAQPNSLWLWVAIVFMLLWMLTLFAWWFSMRGKVHSTGINDDDDLQDVNSKIALQKIKTACEHNNSQDAKKGLIQWGRHQWPDSPPTSVGHVAHKVNGVLAKELNRLNDVLYNPNGKDWVGDPLWLAVKLYIQQDNNKQKQSQEAIKPLFKLVQEEEVVKN